MFRYGGQLFLVIAALSLAPLLVAFYFQQIGLVLRYMIVIFLFGGAGLLLARTQASANPQTNEVMSLVALLFLLTPLVMSYPLMASGLSFMDALFEAISGATTTGLSAVATMKHKPYAFLFARAWMQWYGGLGIVIFTLALLVHPGSTARALSVTEARDKDLVGGTKFYARKIFLSYSVLTIAGIMLLLVTGTGFFNAVVYTLAAVSTGGYAPYDNSLAALGGWTPQFLVTLISLAGAAPLAFYYKLWTGSGRLKVNIIQITGVVTCGILVALALGLSLKLTMGLPWSESFLHAPLLAFSAQTTAGFASLDVGGLDAFSKSVLILSMAIGGGVGSTAGGFKIFRLFLLFRLAQATIIRSCIPQHAVYYPYLAGNKLTDDEIKNALLIILLFVATVVFSWLPFVAMGYDPLDSLFEVVSATGTVGLSAGITSPHLPALLKGVLCFDMLMGRLEFVAWIVLLYPGTWFARRIKT